MKYLLPILLLILGCDTECIEGEGYCDWDYYDCEGVEYGNAELDNCNVCDSDKTNDCVKDCTDEWGGDAIEIWDVCYPIENTTELWLAYSGLTGNIPPEIGNLLNLTVLELSHNQLTGEIPSTIGNLTNLTALVLLNNQLTGEIPQAVCDLIESNNLTIYWILTGNNLINTCD